ncbi:MAG: septal ring lytic transglycosylase RlpA family protein [Pseudohongiellaceae bacterium]
MRIANYTRLVARLTTAMLLMTVTACGIIGSLGGSSDNPNAGRYSIKQDRAPDVPISPDAIAEVVPQPLQRGIAGNRSPYSVLGKTYHVMDTEAGYSATGIASWYGQKFHGHRTSNGEVFDMYQATAAHKSLPIPSYLRVTNLNNNRSLVVRVNDRGPFHGERLIDLSYGAALKLGFAGHGTARVQLDAIVVNVDGSQMRAVTESPPAASDSSVATTEKRYLQVGAFGDINTANGLAAQLAQLTEHPVIVRPYNSPQLGLLHRVRVGPMPNENELRRTSRRVVAADLGNPYTVLE